MRKICSHCVEAYAPDQDILDRLKMGTTGGKGLQFFRGKGCDRCQETGFSGRVGIYEILEFDGPIRDLIINKAPEKELFQAARDFGITTMEENGLYLALTKTTTLDEILRVIPPEDITDKKVTGWEKRILALFEG